MLKKSAPQFEKFAKFGYSGCQFLIKWLERAISDFNIFNWYKYIHQI